MNPNVLLAILEIKGIITNEEAEKVIDYVANKPQSTNYKDALLAVKDLIDAPAKK